MLYFDILERSKNYTYGFIFVIRSPRLGALVNILFLRCLSSSVSVNIYTKITHHIIVKNTQTIYIVLFFISSDRYILSKYISKYFLFFHLFHNYFIQHIFKLFNSTKFHFVDNLIEANFNFCHQSQYL